MRTLEPGDVIFTGTPVTTKAMQPGDVVEVEVEGVGILRNRVARQASVKGTVWIVQHVLPKLHTDAQSSRRSRNQIILS